MVTLDEVLKKQKQQQQQQTQQDQNTQTLRQKLMWNNQNIDAEKALKQSLENEVNYTAFSKNQIKTRAKKAWDFFWKRLAHNNRRRRRTLNKGLFRV